MRAAIMLFSVMATVGAPPASVVKLAFFNIQSGKGEVELPGRPVLFTDTQNCTDTMKSINAWGVGFVQRELVKAVKNDPEVVALGLAEAWLCGAPENVRQLLGWAAKTSSRNGLAVVARHGFAGPETWQELDISRNPNPKDTMGVVRIPVCLDPSCRSSVLMYSAHWFGTGPEKLATYDRQAQQTSVHGADGGQRAARPDRRSERVGRTGQTVRAGPKPHRDPRLRAAGYIDAWPRIHAGAEGFTGMTNRKGCGSPAGYTWKRIDYAWSSPRLVPTDITRFAVPETPGDAAASDHYGIIAAYPMPATSPAPQRR